MPPIALEVGYFARGDSVQSTEYRVETSTGHPYPDVRDLIFRFDGSLWSDRLFPSVHPAGKAIRATLSSGVTYVAPRPLPQGERGDPVFTIDLNATLRWSAFEVGLICTHLLNTQYRLGEYNYVSDFHTQPFPTLVPDRHFSAGAPPAVYATFAVHLGGES